MKLRYWIHFILFIVPTLIITYFMWPTHVFDPYPAEETRSIIGMFVMWFFMGLTFFNGIRAVLKDQKESE